MTDRFAESKASRFSRGNDRPIGRWFVTLLIAGFIVIPASNIDAKGQFTPEQKVKAAYLYKFTHYVTWPESAFENPKSPFVIGILKQDPHGDLLDRIAASRKAQGRRIVVKRFDKVNDISNCHLVFLFADNNGNACKVAIANTKEQEVLLIGDSAVPPEKGFPIRFFHDADGTIGLQINVDAMKQRSLKADAKLLNISTIVRGQ